MNRSTITRSFPLATLALTACTAPPNLIARGMNVTWDNTRHTVDAFVTNERRSGDAPDAAGTFPVYVDPDENPVSSNHRPQVSHEVAGLAPSQSATFTADFSPLAHADNLQLGRVHSITLRADPKGMVAESDETDNELTTPLPDVVGAKIIHGPSLVPIGYIVLDHGRFVGQTFTAPATGAIVGLEVTATRCSAPSSVPLRMEIVQGSTVLGTASVSTNAFAATCIGDPPSISGTAPGAAFFDLRSTPVAIVGGDSYAFQLYNDMPTGSFHVGMTPNWIDGNATDYGVDVMGVDLTYKLFLVD